MANLSTWLLAFMGVIYLVELLSPQFVAAFEFNPYYAISQPWRFVTSMFLHDPNDIFHIIFNGYALIMFGSLLERKVDRREYMIIFFGSGLVGGLLYYLTTLSPYAPLCSAADGTTIICSALGASGAIYGILGAVAMLLPDLEIFFFFFPMKMRYAVIFWLVLTFLGTFNVSSGIADAAHFGGLIFGIVYGWFLARAPPPLLHDTWGPAQIPPNFVQ